MELHDIPRGGRPRRTALAAIVIVCVTGLSIADELGENFLAGNGSVTTYSDAFTDEYTASVLSLAGNSSRSAVIMAYWVADGIWQLRFNDHERVHNIPETGDKIEVLFRVDKHETLRFDATWWGRYELAYVAVEAALADMLAKMMIDAKEIIYRVGAGGDILRVTVPEAMPLLIAEFKRRVYAMGSEAAE